MSYTSIRSFASYDDAQSAVQWLDAHSIPYRITSAPGCLFATVCAPEEYAARALQLIGTLGFDPRAIAPAAPAAAEAEAEADADAAAQTKPAAAPVPPEQLAARVAHELASRAQATRRPLQQFMVLLLSLLLFASFGLFSTSLAGVLLIAGVLVLHAILLGIFAVLSLLTVRTTYRLARIAQMLRGEPEVRAATTEHDMPAWLVERVVTMVYQHLLARQQSLQLVATHVQTVWERVRAKPCSTGAAIALLVFYAFFVVLGMAAFVGVEVIAAARG